MGARKRTAVVSYAEPGLRHRNRALSALLDVSDFLSSTLDLDTLLEGVLDKVLSISRFEAGRIYFKDEHRPYLVLAAHKGMAPEGLERVHVNEGFSGKAFRTRSFISKRVHELEDPKRAAFLEGKGFKTIVCVPLILAERVGGVMNLATGKAVRLNPQDVDLLTTMGSQIAVAVHHAQLYEDLNRQLQVLREKKEMIKFFAYSVSHDLKSPAVGIHGLAKRFQERYAPVLDEKGRTYCHQIMKTAEHMVTLVEKINAYITARESTLSLEHVDMVDLLASVRDEFAEALEERDIRWVQPEGPVEVMGDRTALTRLFRNLLDNALKYGGEGLSEVRVQYRSTGKEHVFLFQDNGAGIPLESRDKVFRVFHREAANREVDGAGLGLAIVKEIAERHGGSVSVESRPEAGAAFRIVLSRGFPEQEPAAQACSLPDDSTTPCNEEADHEDH